MNLNKEIFQKTQKKNQEAITTTIIRKKKNQAIPIMNQGIIMEVKRNHHPNNLKNIM